MKRSSEQAKIDLKDLKDPLVGDRTGHHCCDDVCDASDRTLGGAAVHLWMFPFCTRYL
jgi:hypothetical protein